MDTMKKDFKVEKLNLVDEQQHNFSCKECESLSLQIVQLKRVLERYEKGKIWFDGVLSRQRNSNDKSGLGYSKVSNASYNKTIFVKASNQSIK